MPAAGPAVDESNGPLSESPVSLPTVSPATKPESGLPTLFELYKLASERQARLNPPTEQPEDSSSESDDTSGSESDEDAADFASCRALNIRPDSFHEKGGVPTFRPTMEQFRDFEGFIRAVEPWGKRRGLVKVIPPAEWVASLGNPNEYAPPLVSKFAIKTPINQHFQGTSGTYRQLNIESKRSKWSFQQFAREALSEGHKPGCVGKKKRDAEEEDDDGDDGDDEEKPRAKKGAAKKKRMSRTHTKTEESDDAAEKVKPESADEAPSNDAQVPSNDALTASPDTAPETHFPTPPRDTPAQTLSSSNSINSLPPDILQSFSTLDKSLAPLVPDLEREYWRSLAYQTPMYGADQLGSLFPPDFKSTWNLNSLPNLLTNSDLLLPGVTTPYIYAGMWKSTFAWHLEDMDLYSINYVHWGAPKHWYVVPPPQREKFERVARQTFPGDAKGCREFMRHKQFVISPKYLANQGVGVKKAVQREGEFIVTYPYSYHSGFNCGLNLAEAVNFATKSWIKIGKAAGFCECISDSVKIDMDALLGIAPESDDESDDEEPEPHTNLRPQTNLRQPPTVRPMQFPRPQMMMGYPGRPYPMGYPGKPTWVGNGMVPGTRPTFPGKPSAVGNGMVTGMRPNNSWTGLQPARPSWAMNGSQTRPTGPWLTSSRPVFTRPDISRDKNAPPVWVSIRPESKGRQMLPSFSGLTQGARPNGQFYPGYGPPRPMYPVQGQLGQQGQQFRPTQTGQSQTGQSQQGPQFRPMHKGQSFPGYGGQGYPRPMMASGAQRPMMASGGQPQQHWAAPSQPSQPYGQPQRPTSTASTTKAESSEPAAFLSQRRDEAPANPAPSNLIKHFDVG